MDAFLAASKAGDFERLLALLHPEATLRADEAAARLGATPLVRGARGVAQAFAGRAQAAEPSQLGGEPGLLWSRGEGLWWPSASYSMGSW